MSYATQEKTKVWYCAYLKQFYRERPAGCVGGYEGYGAEDCGWRYL